MPSKRTDYESLASFAGRGERTGSRQSANCDTAAERSAAFAESSRRSAGIMAKAMAYWGGRGGRPDISGLYSRQMEAYFEIARKYDELEEGARLLAELFRGIEEAAANG